MCCKSIPLSHKRRISTNVKPIFIGYSFGCDHHTAVMYKGSCVLPYACIMQHYADLTIGLHTSWSLHRILQVPEFCVIELSCTMQTTQLPLWVMGGLYYRFERAWKGPHIIYSLKQLSCQFCQCKMLMNAALSVFKYMYSIFLLLFFNITETTK